MAVLKQLALVLLGLGLASTTHSQEHIGRNFEDTVDAATYKAAIKESLSSKGSVKGVQVLPITKILFVESDKGIFLISADGRFVFEGKLKDVWHRKTINSLEAARATERVPVSNIGFKPEEQLATFTIGNPKQPRSGVIFVDPTSPMTVKALQKMSVMKDSNWTVILLPLVGGDQAMDRSRRLWCSTDKDGAKRDLINGTSDSIHTMKKPCAEDPIALGLMMTDVFRISVLPLLIREDGLRSEGFPVEFDSWFKLP